MEEMRRVDIVYFLSRKGSIEHPHLIRLHHLSRHGIRLRDVKRWLGEVRGKDMPDSFSWSYKRRYKTGYVWQDLLDDDLITPVSDNEYVLKGSEISKSAGTDYSCTDEEHVSKRKDHQSCLQEHQKTSHNEENQDGDSLERVSPKTDVSSQTFGSGTSTVTDDAVKPNMKNNTSSSVTKQEEQTASITNGIHDHSLPFGSSKKSSKSKGASSSSSIFRNLITCGGVGTNNSAVVPMDKQKRRSLLNMCSNDNLTEVNSSSEIICKRDRLGGSQRVFGTPNWTQHQWSARRSFDGVRDPSRAPPPAVYRPVNGPSCSQCGKTFRPEKMHSHMKGCKGMKAARSKVKESSSQVSRDSISGHLLAQ